MKSIKMHHLKCPLKKLYVMWIPSEKNILQYYKDLQNSFVSLKNEKLMKVNSILPIIDKLKYGIPYLQHTLELNTAIILIDLLKGHLFSDGNKRIALLTMLNFLNQNNLDLLYKDEDLFQFIMKITINEISYVDLREQISKNTKESSTKISSKKFIEMHHSVFVRLGE
jgi:death-on-curing family protein